jgi:hypothetical protein
MPTATERDAARKRANAAIKAGAVKDRRISDDVLADLAVAHDVAPRDVFLSWLRSDDADAQRRLFDAVAAARPTTPAATRSPASGRPVAAGTPAPTATRDYPADWSASVRAGTRTSGVRVSTGGRSRISGEASVRPPATAAAKPAATSTAADLIAAAQAGAVAARDAAQAGTLDRYDPRTVEPSSLAAAAQAARDADQARMRAEQAARGIG